MNINFSLTEIIAPEGLINIADIGAMLLGDADPSYYGMLKSGIAKLIAFEPNAEECNKLLNKFRDLKCDVHPHFVGNGDDQTFYETTYAMTGSLFEPNHSLLSAYNGLAELHEVKDTHAVSTKRLDAIIAPGGLDYIKIDVQGAELSVFQGAGDLLDNVLAIQTEVEFVELYKSQPLFGEVDSFLRSRGFMLYRFVHFGSRTFKPMMVRGNPYAEGTQQLWADVLYVKNIEHADSLSVNQLAKLAVIMHDLYRYVDFVFHLLKKIDAIRGTDLTNAYLSRMRNAS